MADPVDLPTLLKTIANRIDEEIERLKQEIWEILRAVLTVYAEVEASNEINKNGEEAVGIEPEPRANHLCFNCESPFHKYADCPFSLRKFCRVCGTPDVTSVHCYNCKEKRRR